MSSYRHGMKRSLDVLVAAGALVLFSPVLLTVAALVALRLGRPVLFTQIRPGLHGRPFTILKFRTMLNANDSEGQPLPDAERLTDFGRFLRSTSLDELPELINVLRGDMSLVGPRPLISAYLARYTPEQARRHEVRPGITGWAQVNGRNTLDWDDRFALDVHYVDNHSFPLDVKIIWLTLRTVLQREGIHAEGHETMPEFIGAPEAAGTTIQTGSEEPSGQQIPREHQPAADRPRHQ